MTPQALSPVGRRILGALLLAALTLAAYAPVFSAGYVWDDDAYVVKNADLEDGRGLARIWTSPRSSPQYYPLVFTSFWIERQAFGPGATPHHVTNVLLQVANALWLWAILSLLGVPGGYVAALIFALHPVHVESVAWVTERKNLLSGFFYLSALWLYLREALRGHAAAHRMRPWVYVATLLLVGCALLSKTVTATWPVVVLAILWWKQRRLGARDVMLMVPFLALGAAFGLLTAWLEVHHVGAEGAEWSLSPIGRLLLATRIPWFYAAKLVWPHPLVFVYPRWNVDVASAWQYGFPAAMLAAAWTAWRIRHRLPGALTLLVCFVVTLAPALGLLNVYPMRYSWVADHFQYLASIAVIVGLVALISGEVGKRPGWRLVAVVVAAIAVAALGLVSRAETAKFHDLESLWTDTLAKNPGAWIAHNNLGNLRLKAGRYGEARASFEAAIRLEPDLAVAHNNLGTALFYSGQLEAATASHTRAVELDPRYTEAINNLGVDLMTAGRPAEAVEQYRLAIRTDPTYAMAHFNLGNAFVRLGDEEQAEHAYREAIRLKPDLAMAHYSLGLGLLARGRREEALRSLDAAFRLQPSFAQGHYQVGNLALRLGDLPLAIRSYEAAVAARPEYPEAFSNLGAALLRAGKTDEAIARYQAALRLRPDYAIAHFNLASALEQQGRVAEAFEHYREATRLDPGNARAAAGLARLQASAARTVQVPR